MSGPRCAFARTQTEDETAVLLRGEAISNVMYGVGRSSGTMTALCVGIWDEGNRLATTGTTTCIYSSGTAPTTTGNP